MTISVWALCGQGKACACRYARMELQLYSNLATEPDFRRVLEILFARVDAVCAEYSQYFFYLDTLHTLKREFGQHSANAAFPDLGAQDLYKEYLNAASVITRLESELHTEESRYRAACTDFIASIRSHPPLPQTHTAADLIKLEELRLQCETEIYTLKLLMAQSKAASDPELIQNAESLKSRLYKLQTEINAIDFNKRIGIQTQLREELNADADAAHKLLTLLQ